MPTATKTHMASPATALNQSSILIRSVCKRLVYSKAEASLILLDETSRLACTPPHSYADFNQAAQNEDAR